jgi:predicted AAA+ superfamily ATPase
MKQIFKKLIIDSQERSYFPIIEREYKIPIDTKKIVSLIGIRRSGKTYILYNIIEQLRKSISKQNIVYINFEDDRLYPIELKDMDLLVEAYYELFPQKREEKTYFFLDEIQDVEGWEKFVRRIHDTLNVQLFITGSSSKLLSKEIASSLRGRTITYEIFPFSFKEYLKFKQITINLHSSSSTSYIKNAFDSYLVDGGFAETINEEKDIQKRILKNYLDLIIYKDIAERYSIKNTSLLRHLIKYLFINMSTLISFTKLFNEYKSIGYKIGKATIFDYLMYMQEAYTLFTVSIFRNSVKEEQRHPKKLYAIDLGFKQLFDITLSDDYSKLFENLVFLHLRRKTEEIYYFKQMQEVDFYVKLEKEYLINVSFNLKNQKTKDRETNGLIEAMSYFNLNVGYIINSDLDETIKLNGYTIFVIPLWKWLIIFN